MVSQARWSTYQSPRKLRSTAIFIQQLITVKGELALDPTAEELKMQQSHVFHLAGQNGGKLEQHP